MNRVRLVVAVAATFVLASVSFATASDGDPLILGQLNLADSRTVLSTSSTETTLAVSTVSTGIALEAVNESQDTKGIGALIESTNDALVVDGAILTDRAGVVVVPAGATKVTFTPVNRDDAERQDPVQPTTLMLATVQGGTTSVRNVRLDAAANTATIHLTQAGTGKVKVGWFTLQPLP